ncbi:unnamed protein product [Protopolystoma xenopodis]|uniref:Uncharacterized protein n=1 Tax=Protopolystoma xenopodis TaxID=117903 RepID=A0A448WM30_9PLAT|nr:unnamed protein product [Protopolystoma xenopodis]
MRNHLIRTTHAFGVTSSTNLLCHCPTGPSPRPVGLSRASPALQPLPHQHSTQSKAEYRSPIASHAQLTFQSAPAACVTFLHMHTHTHTHSLARFLKYMNTCRRTLTQTGTPSLVQRKLRRKAITTGLVCSTSSAKNDLRRAIQSERSSRLQD